MTCSHACSGSVRSPAVECGTRTLHEKACLLYPNRTLAKPTLHEKPVSLPKQDLSKRRLYE